VANIVEIGRQLEGIRTKNNRGPQAKYSSQCTDLNETHVHSQLLSINPHVRNLVQIGGGIVAITAKNLIEAWVQLLSIHPHVRNLVQIGGEIVGITAKDTVRS
jgi:hypothetical protein